MTGKRTKPAAAEIPSSGLDPRSLGSRCRIPASSGIATRPASTVRIEAITSGGRSSSASRVTIGVPPQSTITPIATATGISAVRDGEDDTIGKPLELEAEVVAVEEHESRRAEDRADDPEADHDLRLRPRLHLEVVVDRRHQEHAFPGAL